MKRLTAIVLSIMLVMAALPAAVFADGQTVSLSVSGGTYMTIGQQLYIDVRAKSSTADGYKLVVEPQDKDITVVKGGSGVITSTDQNSVVYALSAASGAKDGSTHTVLVKAVSAADGKLLQEKELKIELKAATGDFTSVSLPSADVSYSIASGDSLVAGEVNSLTVSMYNRGNTIVRNAKMYLELPSGMTIESGPEAINIGSVYQQGTVSATFPVLVDKSIANGSFKITAVCDGAVYDNSTGSLTAEQGKISAAFYVPVTDGSGKKEESSDVATPILMVSGYSYGGASVKAGSKFPMGFTITNTSKVDLRNIKLVINAGNSFIPVGSSNSLYIERIEAGKSYNCGLTMNCQKDTPQGMTAVSVAMTYEDGNQHTYSATDTVSVPVVQETRLVVDEIKDPGWFTMMDSCYVSVNYRNMGSNQINNLVISAEGDFTIEGDSSYYVGNMASGRSDYYSFTFYPNQAGECTGTVTFTYEDADGVEQSIVKEFTFNIGEGYMPEDPGNWEDPIIEEPGMPNWAKIAIAIGAVAAIVIICVVAKKKKAKKQEALELDE